MKNLKHIIAIVIGIFTFAIYNVERLLGGTPPKNSEILLSIICSFVFFVLSEAILTLWDE